MKEQWACLLVCITKPGKLNRKSVFCTIKACTLNQIIWFTNCSPLGRLYLDMHNWTIIFVLHELSGVAGVMLLWCFFKTIVNHYESSAAASMKSLSLEMLWALSGGDQMDVDWNAAKYQEKKKSNPANCVQPFLMQAAWVINLFYRPMENMWKNFMRFDRMLIKFLHIELTFVLKPHSIIWTELGRFPFHDFST